MNLVHKCAVVIAGAVTASVVMGSNAQALVFNSTSTSGGTVTDDVNKLEWLDLDLTVGQTINSAVSAYNSAGFRWATQSELNGLLDQFFGLYGGEPGTRAGDFAFGAATSAAAEAKWNELFGLTYDSGGFRESLGFYNGNLSGSNQAWFGFNSNPAVFNSTLTPPIFDVGVFLVRDTAPTPVPTPALLPGLIGLGIGVLRKRKTETTKQTSEV